MEYFPGIITQRGIVSYVLCLLDNSMQETFKTQLKERTLER